MNSTQLLITESMNSSWKKNQNYELCLSYKFSPPNRNLLLLEAMTTYLSITCRFLMEHHQYTLELSQGHWQKPYCTRARVQNTLHAQIPEPADGLWVAVAPINSELLDSDLLEWGEGVSQPCAVVWEKDNKGSSGRTRYLSPPPLSLFNWHQEGQRAEESEVCMGLERWERGAAVLSCGHRGAEGAQLCTRGRGGQQAVMAQVGEPYSCHVGSQLRGCHWVPPRNSPSESSNGYRQVSGKTFV